MSNYKVTYNPDLSNTSWNKAINLIKNNSIVLDVGCSTGDFGGALIQHKNCEVDGIEPDKGDAYKASKILRLVHNFSVEDLIFSGSIEEEKYDYVVFLDVIEHIVNPIDVLRLIKKALKPGGGIIFSIPNMAHMSVRLMLMKGDFDYGKTGLLDNTHLHFYTKKEIKRVFQEAGYSISILDFTESAYPNSLVGTKLNEIGLEATEAALRMINDASAQIFQYIGLAVPCAIPKNVSSRAEYSPDPQGEITKMYEQRIKEYEAILRKKE